MHGQKIRQVMVHAVYKQEFKNGDPPAGSIS